MIRRPPRSTQSRSSAASDVYKRQVLVQPVGTNSLKLHFNHVEVHNASYGIRTDGSLLSSPSATVASFISESEFFSFPNAAVNAFSTSGTGTERRVRLHPHSQC